MSKAKERRTERQALIDAVYAQQRAKERKRGFFLYGGFGVLMVAIIVALTIAVTGGIQQRNALTAAAKQPIAGVKTFSKLSRQHVDKPVAYPQSPGVGGDHASAWTNCGVYTTPIDGKRGVHSLEHGAVWISYKPGLAPSNVTALTGLAKGKPYVLLSPNSGQRNPIVLSAWGNQLGVENAQDPRIPTFVKAYAQGPQTPEPGAACSGGVNG